MSKRDRSARYTRAGSREDRALPGGAGAPAVCAKCQSPLRLIALVKNQDIAKKILVGMHLPASVPELHPARPPPSADREARDEEDWLN